MFISLTRSSLLLSLLNTIPYARAGSWGAAPAALSQQLNGVCPNWASINCQSISQPDYCCTEGYYCAYGGPENHIGCCPNNEVCDGSPPSVSTTVYTTTQTVAATTYTEVQGDTTIYVAGGTTEYVGATTTEYIYGTGPTTICSTMTEHNVEHLPTTAAGACGVILIVNGAGRGIEDWALSGTLAALNAVGGLFFLLGLM
ncbi:hypothetical protein AAFC00_005084 [Neodothiora populina]|uniref:Uncharacterized protein n=1 Tax=Neodothiora populina TaxID=2781224 RepID=A0ABR3PJQ6_9PEZI